MCICCFCILFYFDLYLHLFMSYMAFCITCITLHRYLSAQLLCHWSTPYAVPMVYPPGYSHLSPHIYLKCFTLPVLCFPLFPLRCFCSISLGYCWRLGIDVVCPLHAESFVHCSHCWSLSHYCFQWDGGRRESRRESEKGRKREGRGWRKGEEEEKKKQKEEGENERLDDMGGRKKGTKEKRQWRREVVFGSHPSWCSLTPCPC